MLSSSRGMIYKKEKEKNVMKRKKIAIIFGGCSSEYEVSLQSAYAVITHIDQEKYEMVLIGIDQTGVWYLYQGEHADIPSDNWSGGFTR